MPQCPPSDEFVSGEGKLGPDVDVVGRDLVIDRWDMKQQ